MSKYEEAIIFFESLLESNGLPVDNNSYINTLKELIERENS